MKLALSVRIVEAPCKTKLHLPIEQLVGIAAETGYDAICIRASAAGVQTPPDESSRIRALVASAGLRVSMVTADYNVPLNNEAGPDSLRQIGPSILLARALECDLIRVCMKRTADITYARQAAREAAQAGIRLAHQCHTASLFEQVDSMLNVLDQIGEQNFGLIYEPANLMLCGESYGAETLQRLSSRLMNVYVQNHRLDPLGPIQLDTFCLGSRRFHHLPLWEPGGIDFPLMFRGLREVGYDGYITIHQAQGLQTASDTRQYAARCANWLREMEAAAS
jgi:sugar phosphate isomerase/epimerase